ncbi:MAG: hypothetical protein AB7G93_13695 [Bdellovibrionales bacterium]
MWKNQNKEKGMKGLIGIVTFALMTCAFVSACGKTSFGSETSSSSKGTDLVAPQGNGDNYAGKFYVILNSSGATCADGKIYHSAILAKTDGTFQLVRQYCRDLADPEELPTGVYDPGNDQWIFYRENLYINISIVVIVVSDSTGSSSPSVPDSSKREPSCPAPEREPPKQSDPEPKKEESPSAPTPSQTSQEEDLCLVEDNNPGPGEAYVTLHLVPKGKCPSIGHGDNSILISPSSERTKFLQRCMKEKKVYFNRSGPPPYNTCEQLVFHLETGSPMITCQTPGNCIE